jgi:hypothetical protein
MLEVSGGAAFAFTKIVVQDLAKEESFTAPSVAIANPNCYRATLGVGRSKK